MNLYGPTAPTDGSTYAIAITAANMTTNPIISYNGKSYTASSGNVACNLVDGKVKVSFTNIDFVNMMDPNDIVKVSATITTK